MYTSLVSNEDRKPVAFPDNLDEPRRAGGGSGSSIPEAAPGLTVRTGTNRSDRGG
jgi:hypothetical protein